MFIYTGVCITKYLLLLIYKLLHARWYVCTVCYLLQF
jgi:hypothetical protein